MLTKIRLAGDDLQCVVVTKKKIFAQKQMDFSPPLISRTFIGVLILIIILISIASFVALYSKNFYAAETLNWKAQSIGQDIINITIVAPMILAGLILQARKGIFSNELLAGTLLYLVYTFIIYCFAVHFNKLFLVYVAILGLSLYAFIYYLYRSMTSTSTPSISPGLRITIGLYLIIVSCLFSFLWLADLIPALINHRLPKDLHTTGLFTNPVHVLDLSTILPALFIGGMLLLQKRQYATSFAIIMLTFCLLMNITITGLIIVMRSMNQPADYSVSGAMTILALFNIILLVLQFRLPNLSDKST